MIEWLTANNALLGSIASLILILVFVWNGRHRIANGGRAVRRWFSRAIGTVSPYWFRAPERSVLSAAKGFSAKRGAKQQTRELRAATRQLAKDLRAYIDAQPTPWRDSEEDVRAFQRELEGLDGTANRAAWARRRQRHAELREREQKELEEFRPRLRYVLREGMTRGLFTETQRIVLEHQGTGSLDWIKREVIPELEALALRLGKG